MFENQDERRRYLDHGLMQQIIDKHQAFNDAIDAFTLRDVHMMKPLLNHKEVCTLFEVKPGKHLGKLLDQCIESQMLHPMLTTKEQMEAFLREEKENILAKL